MNNVEKRMMEVIGPSGQKEKRVIKQYVCEVYSPYHDAMRPIPEMRDDEEMSRSLDGTVIIFKRGGL